MRVYNLTDVPTPALRAAGLVNVPLKVGGITVQPGESVPIRSALGATGRYIRVGAVHVGDAPPKGYTPAAAPVVEEPAGEPGGEEEEEPAPSTPSARTKRRKASKVTKKKLSITDDVTVSDAVTARPSARDDED